MLREYSRNTFDKPVAVLGLQVGGRAFLLVMVGSSDYVLVFLVRAVGARLDEPCGSGGPSSILPQQTYVYELAARALLIRSDE